jgi:protein SCO1/2
MKRLAILAMVLMSCHSIYLISTHLTSHTTTTALQSPAGPQQASATNQPVICPITGQPLNPKEVCALTLSAGNTPAAMSTAESKNSATDTTEDAIPAGESRMTKLTPEEIKARVYAVDPENRFAYPGRPYVIGSSEWVLDESRYIDQPKMPGVSGPKKNHRDTGRFSDRFTNIELKTENGSRVRFYDDLVKDQIVIITFFYTRCSGICAPTNEGIVELRKLLAGTLGKDVRFLSISLDADFDKPEVLKAFAANYKSGDPEEEKSLPQWDFLCGDWDEINLLRREMGVYDLDPVLDSDRSQHAGIMTFGNDRTSRWSAIASTLPPKTLKVAILKFAGNRFMDPLYEAGAIASDERWEIRGPILEVRPWVQQLSAVGATMRVPNALNVEGTTGVIGRTLKELTDSTMHQGQRVLMPYPKQTSAMVTSAGGYTADGERVADNLRVDLADHLIGGKLAVDSSGQLRINNVSIVENPDLRFPMQILDAVGNEISMEEMPSCPGLPATARGYFVDDVFFATLLQIDRFRPMTHETGIVQVHAAAGDHHHGVLRVFGTTAAECLNFEVQVFDAITDRNIGFGKVVPAADGKSGTFVAQLTGVESMPAFVKVKCGAGSMAIGSPRTVVKPAVMAELPVQGMSLVYGPLQSIESQTGLIGVNGTSARIASDTLVFPLNAATSFRALLAGTELPGSDVSQRSFLPSDYNSGFPVRLDFREPETSSVAQSAEQADATESSDATPPVATLCIINAEECLLTGRVESVDEEAQTAIIGGAVVRIQEDKRLGLNVTTDAGRPLAKDSLLPLLKGLKGKSVTVRGYSHLFRREHAATHFQPVEASVVAVQVELPDGETEVEMDTASGNATSVQ